MDGSSSIRVGVMGDGLRFIYGSWRHVMARRDILPGIIQTVIQVHSLASSANVPHDRGIYMTVKKKGIYFT
jgi:hypothetical protein